jgi:hypothetical protein
MTLMNRSNVIATIVVAAAALDASAARAECQSQACGFNTPVQYGSSIRGLSSNGTLNHEGVTLVPGSIVGGASSCPDGASLAVRGGELVGIGDAPHPHVVCDRAGMIGASFVIGVPVVPHYLADASSPPPYRDPSMNWVHVQIVARSETETWHRDSSLRKRVPTYRLVWGEGAAPGTIGNPVCDALAPMEEWQTPTRPAGKATRVIPWGSPTDHAMMVQGESYREDGEVFASGSEWFNIGCMRTTIAKMRLMGFDPEVDQPVKAFQRVATLKMLAAMYVDATAYTRAGLKVAYTRTDGVSYEGTPATTDPIEAYWSGDGALCLSHRRVFRRGELALLGMGGWFASASPPFAAFFERLSVGRIRDVKHLGPCAAPPSDAFWKTTTCDHISD